ncbi:GE18570 [Mycolicibacterium novocastrense]|uniref:GE18570 n=1 Tax=Mycolicibacterium novocastrense TaxID=59813 RepID=A0ABQ0KGA9_MYCNV|nr:GE18570 [Mycolicibacterium novocastrense]
MVGQSLALEHDAEHRVTRDAQRIPRRRGKPARVQPVEIQRGPTDGPDRGSLDGRCARRGKQRDDRDERKDRVPHVCGKYPRRVGRRFRRADAAADVIEMRRATEIRWLVFILWAKGDLNPHVPKDTGT